MQTTLCSRHRKIQPCYFKWGGVCAFISNSEEQRVQSDTTHGKNQQQPTGINSQLLSEAARKIYSTEPQCLTEMSHPLAPLLAAEVAAELGGITRHHFISALFLLILVYGSVHPFIAGSCTRLHYHWTDSVWRAGLAQQVFLILHSRNRKNWIRI